MGLTTISSLRQEENNIGYPGTAPRSFSFAFERHIGPAIESQHCF
jgi:hypothetical protein